MIILGIDPGSLKTGYGVVQAPDSGERGGTEVRMLACGVVRSDSRASMPERLKKIFDELEAVIERYRPDAFAIETAFCGRNAQSALKLGHARGAALLAAVARNIPAHEYSPREVKRAIVGRGSASKEQVQFMVQALLHLEEAPMQHDAADALAVSICHVHRRSSAPALRARSWKSYYASHPEKFS